MLFTRVFIVSLFIIYSNKYSFEQFLEFLSTQGGLATSFFNILIALFFKRKFEFRVFVENSIKVVVVVAMSARAISRVAPSIFRKKASRFEVKLILFSQIFLRNFLDWIHWILIVHGYFSVDFLKIYGKTWFLHENCGWKWQKGGGGGERNKSPENAPGKICRNGKVTGGSPRGVAVNFVSLTEIRNKIACFRDLLDFSPCVASATLLEVINKLINY